mgnify:CR=1 FL=1
MNSTLTSTYRPSFALRPHKLALSHPWPLLIRFVKAKPPICTDCGIRWCPHPTTGCILGLLPRPWVIKGKHVHNCIAVESHHSIVLGDAEIFGRLEGRRSTVTCPFRELLTKSPLKTYPVKILKDSSRYLGQHEIPVSQAYTKVGTSLPVIARPM